MSDGLDTVSEPMLLPLMNCEADFVMWAQSVSQKTLRTEAFRKTSLCGRQQRGEHRKEVVALLEVPSIRAVALHCGHGRVPLLQRLARLARLLHRAHDGGAPPCRQPERRSKLLAERRLGWIELAVAVPVSSSGSGVARASIRSFEQL